MKCLDTRWLTADRVTLRRWQCACGLRGKTHEQWINNTLVEKPKQVEPKPSKQIKSLPKRPTAKVKTEKHVDDKRRPSQFDDMQEDYEPSRVEDYWGIDIPRNEEW